MRIDISTDKARGRREKHQTFVPLRGVCDGRQIGFARVVSDYIRFAHLLDVFVLPPFRGLAIAGRLMGHILSHPELQTIVRYTLGTRDAHGFYARYGFTAPASPERQIELLANQAARAPQRPMRVW